MLKQAHDRIEDFLKKESKHIVRADPENSSCWNKARILSKLAKFEAEDLCHLAMAIGVGASSLATNDKKFYNSMQTVTSRRLGFTPIHCNPKGDAVLLKRLISASIRRASKISEQRVSDSFRQFFHNLTDINPANLKINRNTSANEQLGCIPGF
jgi:hypothetical protein